VFQKELLIVQTEKLVEMLDKGSDMAQKRFWSEVILVQLNPM
jgi:hypothetical protein